MQTIRQYLETRYFLEHELERSSRLKMIYHLGAFGVFLGKPPRLSDLNADTINRFILHRLEKRSRATVRDERGTLRTIWNDAHENGLLDRPPSRIRKVKKVCRPPEAFTPDEFRVMIAVAESLPGCFFRSAVARSDYWSMFLATTHLTHQTPNE